MPSTSRYSRLFYDIMRFLCSQGSNQRGEFQRKRPTPRALMMIASEHTHRNNAASKSSFLDASPVFAPLLAAALNEVHTRPTERQIMDTSRSRSRFSVGARGRVWRWQIDDNQWSNGLGFAARATQEEAARKKTDASARSVMMPTAFHWQHQLQSVFTQRRVYK